MLSRDGTSQVDPERDYIRQQVRQLTEFVRRLLSRAESDKRVEEALDDVSSAAGRLLGMEQALLDRLTPTSAATVLRDVDRIRTYAAICACEAELSSRLREPRTAERRATRAAALYREVLRRAPADGEADAALRTLSTAWPLA
jgi:hypothetical protein